MPAVGFTLQPEPQYLELLERAFHEEADYLEVAPETTWRKSAAGELVPNGYHALFGELQRESGKPFVAHGVGFSVGSARADPARRAAWLQRIRADQAQFEYRWYTDHLGASILAGSELVLPLPLPMVAEAAARVRASLAALQEIVPDTGVENSVFYYHAGAPLEEPRFLASILDAPRTHLLLDLHNAWTTARNAGFDAWDYVRQLPLERVIEIHVSGGSESDPAWIPSGRVLRLDSHDGAVPEEVWRLLERVLPLCPNLRGVTLERMEGTVEQQDVAPLVEELRRVRKLAGGARGL